MKGSRVQSIIKELRGEKIDIIEWSDEPSVFAANALSPAKVSQVRITDIENREMTVIVGEDQLSLAIGKKGQNVRLATRLVGWDIKIVSEEVLKKEIAQQMGRMIASGEAVPLTELEGVTATQAETLAEKGIEDVEKLASSTVDELSEYLNISMDEAESILSYAREVVAAKDMDSEGEVAETEPGEDSQPSESVAETDQVDPDELEVSGEKSEVSGETSEGGIETAASAAVVEDTEETKAEVESEVTQAKTESEDESETSEESEKESQ
jgi:N utilization substance protein A